MPRQCIVLNTPFNNLDALESNFNFNTILHLEWGLTLGFQLLLVILYYIGYIKGSAIYLFYRRHL
jgi:hypothetical protein